MDSAKPDSLICDPAGSKLEKLCALGVAVHSLAKRIAAGLIEATGLGGLVVTGSSLDNTGGTLLANGAGDILALQSLDVTGGLLEATGGGELLFNAGTSKLESGTSLVLDPTSKVDIIATLLVGPILTLSGGGEVLLFGGTLEGNGRASIVNVSDTIEASTYYGGMLGTGSAALSLTNDAAGVVGNLDLEVPGGVQNAGTLEGFAGGTLAIGLTGAATIDNQGGTILAAGGTVLLADADVIAGTLASYDGGTIAAGQQDVAVVAIHVDGIEIALDAAVFRQGWWDLTDGLRWSNGDATLTVEPGSVVEMRLPRLLSFHAPDTRKASMAA